MSQLIEQAGVFAVALTEIINGSVTDDVTFEVTPVEDKPIAWVFPAGSAPDNRIPIVVTHGAPTTDLGLKIGVSFQVHLDSTGEFLAVHQSYFSLLINPNRPVIRIEYVRGAGYEPDDPIKGRHTRSAAHVQIHGASEGLAIIQGHHGHAPLKPLEKFHFPVGGRRFRPSLEDFIQFLESEQLLVGLKSGWQAVLDRHRAKWLEIQVRSTVKGEPEVAADQLRRLGYTVNSPQLHT